METKTNQLCVLGNHINHAQRRRGCSQHAERPGPKQDGDCGSWLRPFPFALAALLTLVRPCLGAAPDWLPETLRLDTRVRPLQMPLKQEIYVVDEQERPGRIVEVRSNVPVAVSRGTPVGATVYEHPAGAIAAVALFGYSQAYFVPANSRVILKTDGRDVRQVHEHTTYIRDIAFNSRGELFFSEASGGGANGVIHSLGNLETRRKRTAQRVLTVELSQLGGYWGGDFAVSPSDTIFVSTGNRTPGALYERVGSTFERRYSFEESITGFAFTSARRLLFTDHRQTLHALEDFSRRSTFYSVPPDRSMTDVAVVTQPIGARASIFGRLIGGSTLWNLTHIQAKGPNAFWRDAGSRQAKPDGSYTLDAPAEGHYWVGADIRGDTTREFAPRWQPVRLGRGLQPVSHNFQFE